MWSNKGPINGQLQEDIPVVKKEGGEIPSKAEDSKSIKASFVDDIIASNVQFPRLIRRNLPFFQSRNRVRIEHNQGYKIFSLLRHDWFHVCLRYPTTQSFCFLIFIWTINLVIFSGLYVWSDNSTPMDNCRLGPRGGPIRFRGAFAFSLQTCTTVGYTLPNGTNAFFERCPRLQIIIFFQMVWSMMFNAFLFAFFYARVARVDNRGAQVVLSNKAIVTIVDGQVRFQVRVYDVDAANPVVEAHIRMIAITKNRPAPRPLRLIQPNDELGGMLFLSSPAVVMHHIDVYSTLHPPRVTPIQSSGIVLRQADSTVGGREEYTCPICGQCYQTFKQWSDHVTYQRLIEEIEGYAEADTHLSLSKSDFMTAPPETHVECVDIETLKAHFAREVSEVICIVEGIEPISSGTFSSLQSYRLDDIVFQEGARFSPCVEAVLDHRSKSSFIRVDLNRFHDIDVDHVVGDVKGKRLAPQRKRFSSMRAHDSFFANNNSRHEITNNFSP